MEKRKTGRVTESELFSKDAVRVNGGRGGGSFRLWTAMTNYLLQLVLSRFLNIPRTRRREKRDPERHIEEARVRVKCYCVTDTLYDILIT